MFGTFIREKTYSVSALAVQKCKSFIYFSAEYDFGSS
jgi:hypothetical protein